MLIPTRRQSAAATEAGAIDARHATGVALGAWGRMTTGDLVAAIMADARLE